MSSLPLAVELLEFWVRFLANLIGVGCLIWLKDCRWLKGSIFTYDWLLITELLNQLTKALLLGVHF